MQLPLLLSLRSDEVSLWRDAGDRVGSLEGCEDGPTLCQVLFGASADNWRSLLLRRLLNLYIVGRYLLSPLVMDLWPISRPARGGEIQLTDAMAQPDRE